MDNKLSILLVEDDSYTCNQMINIIDNSEDMLLTGVTKKSDKALEIINDSRPDVVILDLELHNGKGSGLDVLKGMKELHLPLSPYILVTTNNSSAITYEVARQLGADYIMSKHQDNYSEKAAIDFLRMLAPTILNRVATHKVDTTEEESPEYNKKRINRRIVSELNAVGINPKSVGFDYLADAIWLTINEPTQNIAAVVARNHKKTPSSVERAMQNAISRAWATTDIEELLCNYTAKISSSKGTPTLTEFIYYYANKIKLDYDCKEKQVTS